MLRTFAYAFRQLGRSPGFTIAAVSSLALGIGANTALFTLLDALAFRSLPVREPRHLVQVAGLDPQGRPAGVPGTLLDLLGREGLFDGVCGFLTPLSTVELHGTIGPRATHALTGDCFATLGVAPAIGRLLGPADDRPGVPAVALLTFDTWQRDFGGRTDALGATLTIEGRHATIVGVTQEGFRGLLLGFPPHVIFPFAMFDDYRRALEPRASATSMSHVFARIKADETIEQATARLRARWDQLLAASVPPEYDAAARERYLRLRPTVTPASTGVDYTLRDRFQRPLLALLGVATLVLLVSCVSVANLLIARAVQRRRETSVRLALGATRGHLMRGALTESLLLAVAGVGAGLALAWWINDLLLSLFGATYAAFALDATPDARALAFTSVVALAAFALFAIAPAWQQSGTDARMLMSGAAGRVAGDRSRLRQVLVVAQVALTLTLVANAALFTTIFMQLRGAPSELATDRVLSTSLMPLPGVSHQQVADGVYHRELLGRLTVAPGVRTAVLAQHIPFVHRPPVEEVSAAGVPEVTAPAEQLTVSDGFMTTLGVPLVAGTDFRRSDTPADGRTVIISESLAHRLFGSGDPIGREIHMGAPRADRRARIVGVARDTVLTSPQARNTLVVYRNFWQAPSLYPALLLRSSGDARQLADTVRRVVTERGREYPLRLRTLSDDHDAALAQERLTAWLSFAFGLLGLILAAIGLYGLLAFLVASRTQEIGIRMALGASRSSVIRLVLREALILVLAGVAIGLPVAWIAIVSVRALLSNTSAIGPAPFVAAVAVLLMTGALAAWVPSHRAASITPLRALREN